MVPYLSRIEGPPPKRNVARSNRAGIAKKPVFEAKAANSSLLTKAGVFLFQPGLFANEFKHPVSRLPTILPDF